MDKITTDQLAICPSCGAAMHFSRIVPSIDGLPEMQTFECRPCQLAITAEQVLEFSEAAEPPRPLFISTNSVQPF
jgi:transposase-like protein